MSTHAPIELPFIHLAPWPPLPETDRCPLCDLELPVNQFGACTARKTGRNLYCKPCINKKVKRQRMNKGEYASRPVPPRKLSLPERVLAAIDSHGGLTFEQIKDSIGLHHTSAIGNDAVSETLAELMLSARALCCEVNLEGENVYMRYVPPAGTNGPPVTSQTAERRHRESTEPLSFTTLTFLHPVVDGQVSSRRGGARRRPDSATAL